MPNTIPGIQGRLSIYLLNELLQLLTTAVAIMIMIIIVLSSGLRGKLLFRSHQRIERMVNWKWGFLPISESSMLESRGALWHASLMGLSSLSTVLSLLSPFAILRLYLPPICDLYSMCFFSCRGYGFVKFTDELEQKRALTECQGAVGLGSKPVRLSVAIPKAWVLHLQGR